MLKSCLDYKKLITFESNAFPFDPYVASDTTRTIYRYHIAVSSRKTEKVMIGI